MSKFKVEFSLKQHTPIIHFQSEQLGATLRATELKPKFDKFLKEYAFDGEIPSEFKITQDKDALDYKVKIESSGIEKSLPNSFLFFANNSMKNDNEKKHMIKATSNKIEFFSYNTELIEIITKYFDEFLLVTNFGARQTKGYGGFTHSIANMEQIFKKYYPIVFKLSNSGNIDRWEDKIDTTQKLLKAGINFRSYSKSLLFQYMCTKNIRWEKRKIKEEFPNVATGNPPIDCNTKGEYRYIRAMLGLAGINEYVVGRDRYTVTIDGANVERFSSPITYKIVGNSIYLLCDRSYENIMDKTFTFKLKGKSFELKTPSQSEFDLYEFLKFVQKQENLIREV